MKRIVNTLSISALSVLSAVALNVSARAETFDIAEVSFDHSPHLAEVTTMDQTPFQGGRYHFVIHVPDHAGEALKAILIAPQDRAAQIDFDLNATTVHRGGAYANGERLNLVSLGGEAENSEEIWVVFDQPVAPGETVTVTLETTSNPTDGVYLFGVTAYPDEDDGVGQFLGYGRIQIYGY
ncbi:DUF2808 domain-containing protein [Nodosilinea sp. LEGE 07298]|uniref:DUF2808 domain-containing protein n=1 Tax=Nodosilinea sp. LEGE 07298 TaxID=2777970 RepID=UPI001882EF3A|nr:DUF2808 domain-containing protein [Nodosilinea sp. LEGE 07298]MBE9108204.1 DUF2808 domain-containing protein [Nodosilinea sp. LEGE 07298]